MFVLPDDINYNPNLSKRLKDFLRALADHCGSKRICWPSQARIAAFMGVTTRTVQRAEREAIELGLVEVKRRWLKSNLYTVLCLEERLSTNATQSCRIEQNDLVQENVRNACKTPITETKNPWRVAKIILSDIAEIMGTALMDKNRGWFTIIARKCDFDQVQQALHELKCRMLEANVGSSDPINNPSGWFTVALRKMGAPI